MSASSNGSAARTIADLDEMEDKLRRLGLDMDNPTSAPSSFLPSAAHSTAEYLSSIRAAKLEKQQARLDRLSRMAVAAEKQRSSSSNPAAVALSGVDTVAGAAGEGHTVLGDRAVLASDVADAALKAKQKTKNDCEKQLRMEQTLKAAAHHQLGRTMESTELVDTLPSDMVPLFPKTIVPDSRERKHQEAAAWCAYVARGLAELAIRVSDNRYLPSTGLGGRPVYRLHQDLSVTQWRQWVEELVFPTSLSATVPGSPQRGDDAATGNDGNAPDFLGSGCVDEQRQTSDADLQREAANCITSATEAKGRLTFRAQREAVACALAKLHAEVVRQRKAAEEAVRLAADELNGPIPPAPEGEVSSPTAPRREELLPGWTQRMPPAACLVYGDDLSGVRLLAATVDMCVQRKFHQQQSSAQMTHRRLAATRQHSSTAGETLDVAPTGFSPTAPSATSHSEDFSFLFVVNEIGVESSDPALSEKGVVVTYVTPRTLLASGALSVPSGDTKRNGSAGRQQRPQQHTSSGGNNTVGSNSLSPGGTAPANSGGGGGATSRGNPRNVVFSPEGRREHEQLIDAVVRESVRVHRHNLGVLASDRMPSWAPKPTASNTGGDSGETEPVVNQTSPGVSASVPLRTLFLLGFPDTPSFNEVLARRLRQATAVAESELMDMESRRRVAEQQANVAATAELSKQRSGTPSKGSKGATLQPSRAKANRPAKAMAGAEELAVAAMVETLQATVALPPLVVLATFLVYDLPTRHRRIEAASLAAVATATLRTGGDDAEDDFNTAAAGGGVVLRSAGPEFTHPVYNPPADDIQSRGLPSLPKELVPTKTTSLRSAGSSSASLSPFSIPSTSTPAVPTAMAAASLCVQTWNVERLRNELKQQHAQQKRQRREWTAAVVVSEHSGGGEQVAGVPSVAVTSQRHAAKRRDRSVWSSSNSVASSNADAERTSVANASRTAETPTAPAVKAPDAGGLPRALFFVRVEDVSDSTAQSVNSDDHTLDCTSLGAVIWRAPPLQPHVGDPQHEFAGARARTVNELMAQLRMLCRPATGRILTNESLAPQQLTDPLRLGDYRLSEATLTLLRKTNKAFVGVLPAEPLPPSLDKGGFSAEAVAVASRDALSAETEVWATLLQYSEELYHLVAEEVFQDGVVHPEGHAEYSSAFLLSTTARFTRVDQSYAGAKKAIEAYTAGATAHLDECLALLIRFSVDVCLAQLAASVRLFCHTIAHHCGTETGMVGGCTTSVGVPGGGDMDEEFLRAVPRLSPEDARDLVDSLRRADGRETGMLLSAKLAEVYWPRVTAIATEVAVQHFTSRSRDNLASPLPAPSIKTPSGQLHTQFPTDGGEAVGESKVAVVDDAAVPKPEAHILAEEHVPAIVQFLLEHAIKVPTPLSRVALLMQESQRMMWTVRDGADAWVESLYREVLSMNSMAPISCPKPGRRPCSLDELADGPLAVLRMDVDNAISWRRPSLWRCGQLEVLLSAVRPATPSTKVSVDHFERGLYLQQLQRLWRFLPDVSAELAARVGFSMTTHKAHHHVPSRPTARPATFASMREENLALPDSLLDAYLLTSCPCRPSAEPPFPFLTVEDVRRLSAAAVTETETTKADGEPASRVDLELWLANLALQRCCFCDARGVSCGQGVPADAQVSPCTRASATMLCSSAVRKTIATLPTSVLAQHTLLCVPPTSVVPSLVYSPPPFSGEMPGEWMLVQWWWRVRGGEDASGQMEDVQRCYALWRILLGYISPSPSLTPEYAASTSSTMAPLLLSLLRLLVGIGRRSGSLEERVRRAFHCLAVLRRVRASDLETYPSTSKGGDADAEAVMFIEDGMTLTVDECAALGRLLSPTVCTVDSDLSTVPSTLIPETGDKGDGMTSFFTDVQLLLQVEGTKGVTLPLLFSSRWASLLMKEHF